jgi:hypothetical protein
VKSLLTGDAAARAATKVVAMAAKNILFEMADWKQMISRKSWGRSKRYLLFKEGVVKKVEVVVLEERQ